MLSQNQIAGAINLNGLNLRVLYVDCNEITAILNLKSQSNLEYLRIGSLFGGNRIAALEDFCQLDELIECDCSYNSLTSLPVGMDKCVNLTYFDASNNQIFSLPKSLGRLQKLRSLRLLNNQLSYIPQELSECSSLQLLDVSENNICVIPVEFIQSNVLVLLSSNPATSKSFNGRQLLSPSEYMKRFIRKVSLDCDACCLENDLRLLTLRDRCHSLPSLRELCQRRLIQTIDSVESLPDWMQWTFPSTHKKVCSQCKGLYLSEFIEDVIPNVKMKAWSSMNCTASFCSRGCKDRCEKLMETTKPFDW